MIAIDAEPVTVMVRFPSPCMASTAFLVRFSITHSKSDWHSITPQLRLWSTLMVSATRLLMRERIYSMLDTTLSLMNASSISGFEPIFEKRSAITLRRCTSLSMSLTMSASTPSEWSICVHAISDEMGVPS